MPIALVDSSPQDRSAPTSNRSAPQAEASRHAGASVTEQAAVLVVEDNVSNFHLVARMLEALDMHCEWKTSGYQVLEYAEALPRIDLILMDIRLPYESGFSAGEKLRTSERFRSVPILAVSAVANRNELEKARAAGFNGFLGKPLDPDRFPEQIRRVLAGEQVWELA
jgi:two-component system cell cycle response regulator DivK